MKKIDNLSADANQLTTVILADNSGATIGLKYLPRVQRWRASVTYKTFQLDSIHLAMHPNILRQFRNLIPFGMAVFTEDAGDPIYLEDFSNGRASIFILNQTEMNNVENILIGLSS